MYVFHSPFPFQYVSGEMDRLLALIERLPATPLTTQVICVWFLDQGRAAKTHDGWPVRRRDARQNHVMYNGAPHRANEHATLWTTWNMSLPACIDKGFIQIPEQKKKIEEK